MIYAPINGSQINSKAKLYKRFTTDGSADVSGDSVVYQNNNYVYHASFAWVEATGCNEEDYQPLQGLITHTESITIKMNAPYFRRLGDLKIPEHGDIVRLHGKLWIIEDGVQKERHKTLKDLATYYLPLKSLL